MVMGASHRRGHLLVEHKNHHFHVPYQFLELKPSNQSGVDIWSWTDWDWKRKRTTSFYYRNSQLHSYQSPRKIQHYFLAHSRKRALYLLLCFYFPPSVFNLPYFTYGIPFGEKTNSSPHLREEKTRPKRFPRSLMTHGQCSTHEITLFFLFLTFLFYCEMILAFLYYSLHDCYTDDISKLFFCTDAILSCKKEKKDRE